jgi:ABC-2 type transport system ATP-binding protein
MTVSGAPVVIRTRGLEKRYPQSGSDEGKLAVRSLDLDIHQGEVFGLLGPNGAGKTTTILMLLGLTEPTGGTAEVLGFDPLRDPLQVKRHVGYLPDNVGFYGNMTGRENLRYTARLNGIPDRESEGIIDGLLDRVGLSDAGHRPVDTYSRGMRQRLGLADVLVKDPAVVILDEPTASIDPVGVQEVLDLVRSLARDQGVSVLLSSHLLHQVQQVCDRIAIFVEGEVVAMGTVAQIAARQQRGLHVTVDIGTDGAGDEVAGILRGVPGVVSVERDHSDQRLWSVTCPPEVRGAVLSALVASGHVPWLVRDRGMELDEIYQRYFASAAAAPEEVAA